MKNIEQRNENRFQETGLGCHVTISERKEERQNIGGKHSHKGQKGIMKKTLKAQMNFGFRMIGLNPLVRNPKHGVNKKQNPKKQKDIHWGHHPD